MREIEFRTFCKSLNKMLSFEHLKEATKGMVDVANEEMQKRGLKYNKLAPYGLFLPLEDDDLIFMQYTGLTDKNGTKIFEGDIVKVLGMTGKVVCECGSFGIAFNDCVDYKKIDDFTQERIGNNFFGVCCDNFISFYEVYWNLNNLDECLHEVEVIGNIHDNPELLEEV